MFYTIYDAIVFKADKDGIKEDEVKKRLRKKRTYFRATRTVEK